MLNVVAENSFRKDLKRELKRGLDSNILYSVVDMLQSEKKLESKYRDHKLQGNYVNCRECHIKPDLLLIYRVVKPNLYLIRLGSHSDLF